MKTPGTGKRNKGLFVVLFLLLVATHSQAQGVQIRIGVKSLFAQNGPQPDFTGQPPGALLPQVQLRPTPGYEVGVAKSLQIGRFMVQPEVKVSLYRIGYKLVWSQADKTPYGTQANMNTTGTVEGLFLFREPITKGENAVSLLVGPYMQVRSDHYTEISQGSPNTIFPTYQKERLGIEDKYRTGWGVATGVQMALRKFDVRLLAQFGKTALFSSNWQQYKGCIISLSAGYTIGRTTR
ncbi:hypothetical protein [Spirosoma sp. 209]|uniref:hypothetical protein n=1 Tax=Spirosoma sp. 209 TaxID=1955701 RepID=UPI00098D26F1|nr:hypothetical protein [Spirosoma sp. 209]